MKKFKTYLLLVLMAFCLCMATACNEDGVSKDEYDAKVEELTNQINALKAEKEQLEQTNNTNNSTIADLNNQISQLQAQIDSLNTELNKANYEINVYDIDGSKLKSVNINGTKDDNLFEVLKNNFEVEYTESEWGPYISSIEGSVKDPNYFVSISVNNVPSEVGIGSIKVENNAVYNFSVECWNTDFDETDKLVDKFVYGFIKNYMNTLCSGNYVDYTVLAAYDMMINAKSSYGSKLYDESVFNTNFSNKDKCLETYNTTEYTSSTSVGNLFKAAVGFDVFGLDNTKLKEAVNGVEGSTGLYGVYSLPFYLVACEKTGVDNDVYKEAKTKICDLLTNTTCSDSTLMLATMVSKYSDIEGYTEALNAQFAKLSENILENGVKDNWSGVNSASTAQAILALTSNNVNPRTFKEGVDLVSVLLTYTVENGILYKEGETTPNTSFATPQGLAALLAYKYMRDTKQAAGIYNF